MTTRYRNANHSRNSEIKRFNIVELIGFLKQTESVLREGIRAEEDHANARDPKQPGYPTEARLMNSRLQNIRDTINRLETKLAAAKIAQTSYGREAGATFATFGSSDR